MPRQAAQRRNLRPRNGAIQVARHGGLSRRRVRHAGAEVIHARNVLEIHAPGSPPLLSAIVGKMSRRGARPAQAGEFTKRAFLNGRIDLAQAEAVLALIRARNDEERRLALSGLGGDLSKEARGIRGRLMDLVVDMEAGLDFHEDEVEFASARRQREEIAGAAAAIETLLSSSVTRAVFKEEVLVVLYGAANAGKSSLFNMLAGAEKSIVHHTPGTTRDRWKPGSPRAAWSFSSLIRPACGLR